MNRLYYAIKISVIVFGIPNFLHCGGEYEVILPNGWRLTPVGEQIFVGEFPLGMAVSPDGNYIAITNNGSTERSVSIVNIKTRREIQRIPLVHAWLGTVFGPDGKKLYVSGGGSHTIEVFNFTDGTARHETSVAVDFPAGLAASPDRQMPIAALMFENSIATFNRAENGVPQIIRVGALPYGVTVHPDGNRVYVSNRGGQSVSVVDLANFREVEKIPAGQNPGALLLSPDGTRLYVANTQSDDVTVIDTGENRVIETIPLAPYQDAPRGTQPTALSITGDGKTLFVANAGNNAIAVVDISGFRAKIKGFIPTGFYPTAVSLSKDDSTLLVLNGKGLGSRPGAGEFQGTQDETTKAAYTPGTLSFIDLPDERTLADYTAQVIDNNGFENMAEKLNYGGTAKPPRAIPQMRGETSLINYVFFILKGNLGFEQLFGDSEDAEGDSSPALFGHSTAPNHHALAQEFVLLDNFYVEARTQVEGIQYSTAGFVTDLVSKLAPNHYFNFFHQNEPYRAEETFISTVHNTGYLWDIAAHNDISYRSYGLFVTYGLENRMPVRTLMKNLAGHTAPNYPPYDPAVTDVERAAEFIQEFTAYVAGDSLPRLSIVYLPNDDMSLPSTETVSVQMRVADNDRALGMIVDAISHSPIWKESVIFIVESSAPENVTGTPTGSVALVASPFARRGYTDHTIYTTASILRSIGLILGLPPVSQYDAYANPLHTSFQDVADIRPFNALTSSSMIK